MSNDTNETHNFAIRRFQCRHIFTDGHRCGSPCLRGEDFCYYHHETRSAQHFRNQSNPLPHDPYNEPPNQTGFLLPLPEDHSSIQHAIGRIMNRLASNALDPRRAGLLLYALQIASGNLKSTPDFDPEDTVDEVTLDPLQGPLAPQNELPGDAIARARQEAEDRKREAAERYKDEDYDEDEEDEDEDDEEEEDEEEEDDNEEEDDDEEDDEEIGSLNIFASAVLPQPRSPKSRKYPAKSRIERTLEKSTPGGRVPSHTPPHQLKGTQCTEDLAPGVSTAASAGPTPRPARTR